MALFKVAKPIEDAYPAVALEGCAFTKMNRTGKKYLTKWIRYANNSKR